MITSWCTLFVFLTLLLQVLGCRFDAPDERGHCPSFEALKLAGQQLDWKRLNVNNDGTIADFSRIKTGTFRLVPNVIDLQVSKLANGIDVDAFDGLYKLYELHLDDNNLKLITKVAFANLPITLLFIHNCNVSILPPGIFDKTPNLRRISIVGNHISKIEEGVFTNTKLDDVVLRSNHIKTVEANAFGDMENLKYLSLEDNELTVFNSATAVGYAPRLERLHLNNNKLHRINRSMFSSLPNVRYLLLQANAIKKLDDHVFRDLRQLILLDISENKLETMQESVFYPSGHTNLHFLYLHHNQLSFLSPNVLKRVPNLERISIGDNPLHCPCLSVLETYLVQKNIVQQCHEEFSKGNRPSCVYSSLHPNECIFENTEVDDTRQIYAETIKEYEKLPICHINRFP